MGRIVIVTQGLRGLLYSSLELAARLEGQGHTVILISAPEARDLAEANGVAFRALPGAARATSPAQTPGSLIVRFVRIAGRQRQALDPFRLDDFVADLRDLDPDLLLIDLEMHEHIFAASRIGVPFALLNSFVSIWRHPKCPPPHRLARPGHGPRGTRLGTAAMWLELRWRKRWRRLVQWIRTTGLDRVSVLRRYAADHGLEISKATDAGNWLIPFTYRDITTFTLHAREFEFPHRPADFVHFVGPMVALERIDDRGLGDADQQRLSRLLERRRRDPSRRLVFAAFGSWFTHDRRFLRELFRALTDLPDWDLTISLGGTETDLGEAPPNVHVFPWLPQPEVLRVADVAIVHGGTNSADECVLSATPMLVCCGHRTDMAGTTSRIEFHGLGRSCDPNLDARAIAQELVALASDRAMRSSLTRMRSAYLRYAEEETAESLVASMLDPAPDP